MEINQSENELHLYPINDYEYLGAIHVNSRTIRSVSTTTVILDRSGSMKEQTSRFVTQIIPLVMSKLGYDDNYTINLITFAAETSFYQYTRKGLMSARGIQSEGKTLIAPAIEKLRQILQANNQCSPIRVLTISDGVINDSDEAEYQTRKLVDFMASSNLTINSQAVRMFTSTKNPPDTKALSYLLQINNTTATQLFDATTKDTNETIARNIAAMFKKDNFHQHHLLQFQQSIVLKFPWNTHASMTVILSPGWNIFWFKHVPTGRVTLGNETVNVIVQKQFSVAMFHELLEFKLEYIADHMTILKIVGTYEARESVGKIYKWLSEQEESVARKSSTPNTQLISNLLRGIFANSTNFHDSNQMAQFLRDTKSKIDTQRKQDRAKREQEKKAEAARIEEERKEAARIEEEKKKADELKKQKEEEEAAKKLEEEKKAEAARIEEEKKKADELKKQKEEEEAAKKLEEDKKAEAARIEEEKKKADELKKQKEEEEAAKKLEEEKKAEAARIEEEKKKADELKKQKEEEEAAKKLEEDKKAEAARIEEEKKKADELKKQKEEEEAAKKLEEDKKAEAARIEEEKKKADELKKQKEAAKKLEEDKKAEAARIEEEKKKAARIEEEKKKADELKKQEEEEEAKKKAAEAARIKKQEEEKEEAARIKKQEEEDAEAARIKKQEEEKIEADRIKKQEEEDAEAALIKKQEEQKAAEEEADRIKKQEEEDAEAARIKKQEEQKAAKEEADRIKKQEEQKAAEEEADRIKKQEEEDAEVARIKKQEEQKAAEEEADRIKKQEEEDAEAARIKKQEEQKAAEEEADRIKQQLDEERAAVEEADRKTENEEESDRRAEEQRLLKELDITRLEPHLGSEVDSYQTVLIVDEHSYGTSANRRFSEQIMPLMLSRLFCGSPQLVHLVAFVRYKKAFEELRQPLLQSLDAKKPIRIFVLTDEKFHKRQEIEHFAEMLIRFLSISNYTFELQVVRLTSTKSTIKQYKVVDIDVNESNDFVAKQVVGFVDNQLIDLHMPEYVGRAADVGCCCYFIIFVIIFLLLILRYIYLFAKDN